MSEEANHQHEHISRPLARPRRGRGRLIAGTAGLAAILGAGAYIITGQIVTGNEQTTVAEDVRQIAPAGTESAAPPTAATTAAAAAAEPESSESIAPVPTVDASGSPVPPEVVEEIKEARKKMAAEGVPLKPPVIPKATVTNKDIEMTTEGSLKEGGTLRILKARADLTGQRELAYVAGGVKNHRKVPCTQTFQFSTNPAPEKKDNLVICWKTTPEKSVVAMVVDPKGHPSRDKAVDAIEKEWRAMG